jgi:hypothetical protein
LEEDSMALDRFMIAPFDQNSGQQTDVKPWLIPDQAFEQLVNAYVFRGRVRKRFGSRYLGPTQLESRLRIAIATTDGSGDTPGGTFVPRIAGVPIAPPAIGQMFSVGTQVFTVNVLGTPADMLISGAATLATFDTTTGEVVINGADANTDLYYYPALPVMGLLTYESNDVNFEPVIAFDTRFAYEYTNGWERLDGEVTANAARWIGNNAQFFWGTTWTGANGFEKVFFVTNFNENEPNFMRFFFNNQWDNFRPQISAGPIYLNSARILVPFKNRLVAFNTWEGAASPGDNYPNRCRYSQIGSPLAANAWRQDIAGLGNALDAPTTEAIVTVEFVKDRLIVFFEESTWELVYTGNQAYPFSWQQINTELGAESTFSIVPFDKFAVGVGNVGIHACNGVNVERIDNKIPDTVFDIHNDSDGPFRVYGIRDYYVEMVYWTFPDTQADDDFPYPNRVLVFNYKTGTWAFNDDSITCFGYYQPEDGVFWTSQLITWNDEVKWNSGAVQARVRQVVAGNQEGYTFVCDPDYPINASALQITDIAVANNIVTITAIDHNLRDGDYVYISDITGTGNITLLNETIFQVIDTAANPLTPDTFTIVFNDNAGIILAGLYSGAGLIARVSNIIITTKQYNFYAQQGRNAYVQQVNFLVDATPSGKTQVEFFASTASTPLLQESAGNQSLVGTGTLETSPYASVPFELTAERVWHPVYFQAEGEVVQFKLIMNDAQMRDIGTWLSGFQLNAMIIYAMPTSRLQ